MAAAAGTVIDGRYELVSPLEGVGLGETWRARDPKITARVFVLRLLGDIAGDAAPAPLVAQVKALRRLPKEVAPTIVAHGVWRGRAYLVLAAFEGRPLREEVAARRPLADIAALFARLTAAVAIAHRGPVPLLHGDLCPEAIVVTTGEGALPSVRVLDFGMGAFADPATLPTRAAFAAPERRAGGAPSVAADVFSLGAILRAWLEEPTLAEGRRAAEPPRAVVDVVARAMADAPGDRFPSVAAMEEALKDAWSAPPGAPAPRPPETTGEAASEGPPTASSEAPPAVAVAQEASPVVAAEAPRAPEAPRPTVDPAPAGPPLLFDLSIGRPARSVEPEVVSSSPPPLAAPSLLAPSPLLPHVSAPPPMPLVSAPSGASVLQVPSPPAAKPEENPWATEFRMREVEVDFQQWGPTELEWREPAVPRPPAAPGGGVAQETVLVPRPRATPGDAAPTPAPAEDHTPTRPWEGAPRPDTTTTPLDDAVTVRAPTRPGELRAGGAIATSGRSKARWLVAAVLVIAALLGVAEAVLTFWG